MYNVEDSHAFDCSYQPWNRMNIVQQWGGDDKLKNNQVEFLIYKESIELNQFSTIANERREKWFDIRKRN